MILAILNKQDELVAYLLVKRQDEEVDQQDLAEEVGVVY